ncbi:hypothetical protein LF1_21350 [Rubripirellula obstinata]|uniref:Uncharacterized protein n=1 Tax=Rubripirellula obstinata TaxID=406547 RepID=A0A5B1CHA8_9BACT|nr:hypothetical protein LF1_21350 [Rubripirellula obstinata]
MFILQFAMFDWFAKNITHRIFISPGNPSLMRSGWDLGGIESREVISGQLLKTGDALLQHHRVTP